MAFQIIAEKINGTRKSVGAAVVARDQAFIEDLATRQAEAGATWIDVNAGTSPEREPEDMVWLVEHRPGRRRSCRCPSTPRTRRPWPPRSRR